jgi:hypothetical protein
MPIRVLDGACPQNYEERVVEIFHAVFEGDE